ncbi:uncharacterized protein LOC111630344 [Centruroides sculpturatus]|uniref:uncharacterized protein LOC111630344 n=1 Tax=Centruroides sculpturatus TaxID=218467 RepID=UPI000C6EF74D|nr:uncharacterized protein LOC111630344 [Centruroides sculpturatus]
MSVKINSKLIEDFLLPALFNKQYGKDVEWTNRNDGKFRIKWPRITQRTKLTDKSFKLFMDWDKLKGRDLPSTTQELVRSRQRFKAALRKLKIKSIPNSSYVEKYREFQIKKDILDQENIDLANICHREEERSFQESSNRPESFKEGSIVKCDSNINTPYLPSRSPVNTHTF